MANAQEKRPLENRTIATLSAFRFILSLVFILTIFFMDEQQWLTVDNKLLFFKIAFGYFIFSATSIFINMLSNIKANMALPLQITIDIVFIVLLMHLVGGISSGFGILLIIIIVIGSLISHGQLALYYASVATIAILVEHSLRILLYSYPTTTYTQPVLLSLSCFATAWLAHSLGIRMLESQQVASKRSIDLANMGQVNALITQEMQDGVLVVDSTLNIVHSNAQAIHLLSLPDAPKKGHTNLNSLPDILALYLKWTHSDESSFNINLNNNQALKIRFMPAHKDESSQDLGAVIFIQDLSQLQSKAQQEKLAALGRLTAKIAHEVRNPLSAISHANQLLQEDIQDSRQVRVLEIVEDNISRIDKIIKDVLELNRRDRTKQAPVELNKFIIDFHHQFCAVEKINPEHFTLTLLSTPQVIMFDQRHLTQILWNLALNGWEHSQKSHGSLKLSLENAVVNLTHLIISDDGEGVLKENRPKLFEPFYTTKSTGSGLGLYISRELAEANGATLQYQGLAQGSAFNLQIPQT